MPGDLFAGDIAGRDQYTGFDIHLFRNPGAWDKAAINNHYGPEARGPMVELLRAIKQADQPAGQERLSELLDMEAFGRFSAFESLAGTVHYDSHHNWRLFYDPWLHLFVPAVWDPIAWHTAWRAWPHGADRFDVISSPFHVALFKNADFLRAREKAFLEFFQSGTHERFLSEVDQALAQVDPLLDFDSGMTSMIQHLGPDRVRPALLELRALIERLFADQRSAHLGGIGRGVQVATLGPGHFALGVSGRNQVQALRLTFDRTLEAPLTGELTWLSQGQTKSAVIDGRMSVQGRTAELQLGLLSRVHVHAPSMHVVDATKNGLRFSPGVTNSS